jgi:erythronate-4-phosphate dehydrogenase
MNIVADENIPYVKEAFGDLGEVITLPGRKIDASSARDAEILLVRSITKVDSSLLQGSSVRFVGSATIGTYHVDQHYLESEGIIFASAPGSNANSVAEYVIAALLTLAKRKGFCLKGKKIGVIGVGNCGSRVAKKAEALGMRVVLNDPPLWRETADAKFRPIEELWEADILTLHVPLTYEGLDATHHMVNEAFLGKLRTGCILVNTSRGAVVDNRAVLAALNSGKLGAAVFDVWENEPNIDLGVLDAVDLATPHIAGYSLDGKTNATTMVYEAACKFLGVKPEWKPASVLPKPDPPYLEIARHQQTGYPRRGQVPDETTDEEAIANAVRKVYDIEKDDAALRRICETDPSQRGAFFDRLRKDYPVRREFQNTEVYLPQSASHLAEVFMGLGFRVRM